MWGFMAAHTSSALFYTWQQKKEKRGASKAEISAAGAKKNEASMTETPC